MTIMARNKYTQDNILISKHNGMTQRRYPCELIRIMLPGRHGPATGWRAEPLPRGVVRRVRSGIHRISRTQTLCIRLYRAVGYGTVTINLVYREDGVIKQRFKLRVEVVHYSAPLNPETQTAGDPLD